MPVTPAEIDAAVPPAGTPNRGLTNTALKGLITDIAAVGVGVGIGTVNTFADLPPVASHTGERWWVLTSTGVWLVNRKTKGAYYSDGAVWSYLGDFPVTAVEVGNTPAGGIAAVNVQSAIDELDTEKAPLASPTFTGTVGGITKSMVGLSNVDNTSDANKPVSTATQTALDLKVDEGAVTTSGLTMATARLLGRSTAATGAIEEITLGTNLSFTGTTLNATGGGGGGSITVEDEGTPLTTAVTLFDFAGAGVTVTEPVADQVLVTIPGTPDPLPLANVPTTPGAGIISVGRSKIAEFPFLAFKGSSGLERLVQPFLGTIPLVGVTAFGGGAIFGSLGQSPSIQGTAATVDVASTNVGTRTPRMNLPTSAAAGNTAGVRNISRSWFVGNTTSGGGVFFFAIVTQGTVAAGQRVFMGPRSTVASPTNVEPATLTNSIGLGTVDSGAGVDNWHIVFGGSAAQTPIDLGVNFPCRGSIDDKIQFSFYWPPGNNDGFYYEVIRNEGAFTASGFVTNTTPGTTLPADTTGMTPNNSYWTNNATAAVMSMRVSCMLTFVL